MSTEIPRSVWKSAWSRMWVILLGFLLLYLCAQPDVESLRHKNPTTTALIELRKKQAERAHVHLTTQMIWRNLDEISPNLVHAVLLSEDDTFYQHHGFDLNETWEAVKINWKKKRYAYGGSTISQQLARTLYLSPRKNLIRKLKEALLTIRLERALSKHRILEIYLNVIEWGQGIYGAEAAAEHYFGKSAMDLTPDEAVALASILPSPRRWSPSSEQTFMARRRTQLLDRMQRAGYVVPYDLSGPTNPFVVMPSTPDSVPTSDGLQGEITHEAPEQP